MSQKRAALMLTIFLLLFTGILGRLFFLQVISGQKIAAQAINMRTRDISISEYQRGDIYDRNMLLLTNTVRTPALYCLPQVLAEQVEDLSQDYQQYIQLKKEIFQNTAAYLASVLCASENQREEKKDAILKQIETADKQRLSFIRLHNSLNSEQERKIINSNRTGLIIAPYMQRYSNDNFCTHILGYVNRENHGVAGIEHIYDAILHGDERSHQLVSVMDARGKAIKGLMTKIKEQETLDSQVVLTIDKNIQQIVESEMNKSIPKGCIVIMDVESKDILAMASRPTFNPNILDNLDAADSPMINRALTAYHPGSLFKMLVSIAALEEGIVNIDDKFSCSGSYTFNSGYEMDCWDEDGHGELNLAEAFANSCNPAFIQVGLKTGRKKIMQYAQELNLCNPSIIGYSVNNRDSHVEIDGGEIALANACLGQQGVMVSPLQICSLVATIADDGFYREPVLVKSTRDQNGSEAKTVYPQKRRLITARTAELLQKMMQKTVQEGTGKRAAFPECQSAGKTATSQTGKYINPDEELLNVWFAGYFPATQPRFAIVILREEGKSGSQDCAPIFAKIGREILKYYSFKSSL